MIKLEEKRFRIMIRKTSMYVLILPDNEYDVVLPGDYTSTKSGLNACDLKRIEQKIREWTFKNTY